MNTYTITFKRRSTGETARRFITQNETEEAARRYAKSVLAEAGETDLVVAAVEVRDSISDNQYGN